MEFLPCTPEGRRCEYWTWRKDYLRPDCCTRHLKGLLAFTEELFSKHGIFHFLDFGTLLGAVRQQRLIEWDEDADFSCVLSDLQKVLDLKNEIEAAGFWLDTREAPRVLHICRSRTNLAHADVWFLRIHGNFASTYDQLHEDRLRFPVSYLDRIGRVTLEGKLYPAPMPVEQFLAEHRYGPDFMTPRRIAGNMAWLSNHSGSAAVQATLDQLQDVEYRIGCLEAKRENGPLTAKPDVWQKLMVKATASVPRSALHLHRAIWKTAHRIRGERDGILLEATYALYRREAVLRLMNSHHSRDRTGGVAS